MKRILLIISLALIALSATAQNKYCGKIKTTTDKFTKDVRHQSPMWAGTQISKKIVAENGDVGEQTYYFLYLTSACYNALATEKGVTLLFSDGSTIRIPIMNFIDSNNRFYFETEKDTKKGDF